MSSPAASQFLNFLERGRTLAERARDRRIRPIGRKEAGVYLHAALATYVASWDSYTKMLSAAFFTETADPGLLKFSALHDLLSSLHRGAIKKLNTPNSDNVRTFLVSYTGYDPIGDWIWPERSMNGLIVRQRLDEILKVRHSFAHGIAMPAYGLNTTASGDVRLTFEIVKYTEKFLVNLVTRTDNGMKQHILLTYDAAHSW